MSSSLGAMGSLPGKLRLLLVSYKDQLPDSLKDEIKLLIEDLEDAHNVLVDLSRAEAPMVKLWRNEMREMSYDMEDYIDKQTTHLGYNQFDVEEFGILVDLTRDACKSNYRYHLGRLRPQNPSFLTGGHSRVQTLNREATYIVGMDDARRKLISWLRDDAEQRLKVVPILGPVGVGKTTLAQQVYREIGGWFECRAFVRASRMTDTGRLLWSIISQIKHNQRPSHDYTVQKLLDCLSEHLQHKRYFIVIDGLWETASWNIVISAFPGNTCCSRVLITTDIEEVALECSDYQPNSIFLVEPLRRDYSADLLYNRVSGYKPELREQLKENLEDIIRTCCGLPLAIISIANILESQPDNPLLWCQVKECISSRLRNNLTPEGILREIVGLSYDCLSHDLKICLLYLAVYPEGYTFLKADLLKQWISESFISAVKENANEVAESIFDELVCRGLIQPNHINFSDTVWSYTVHSAMFEVIRYKSIEENFCTVIDYSSTIPELSAKVRRLSLRYGNAKYAAKPEGITLSPVRSLIFHGFIDCLPSVTEFEVLRVINLEFWGGQEELDLSGISQLFQLRYMRIAADITVKLPAEMKGFQYLETLEIYGRVTSVPSDIAHLPSLLHLSIPGEIKLSDGTSNMRSLRTLHSFDLSSNSEDNVQRLGQMTDLHDLHLTCSKSMSESDLLERNLIALARSIGELGKLKSLVLAPNTSCLSCSFYSDCSSSMPCLSIFLQRLELLPPICIFSRLPKWFEQLRKLRVLKIVVRELTMNDIDTIAGLQELIILSLFVRQPSAEKIAFNRAAFPVLKYFKYRCGILRLAFHTETMPYLRTLKLEFSARSGYQYDDMLTGIENLLNLQEVAGRIGTVPGAQESDMCCVESAFNDAIIKHPKPLEVNVQTVDWVDQETSEFSTEFADLDEQLIRLARAKVTNVVSEESACSNISHPFSNENEMAGIVVSISTGVMKTLLKKLTTLMGDEYKKFKGLQKEVSFLKNELSVMNTLLEKMEDADELDPQAKNWRKDLIEMSYNIEDYIDNFMYHIGETDENMSVIRKAYQYLKTLKEWFRVPKTLVIKATEHKKRYMLDQCIPSATTRVIVDPRIFALYHNSKRLVGIDSQKEAIISWVKDEGQQLKVMSIVGFGGLGKTTLANEVYHEVGTEFTCKAFISISQNPDIIKLLNSLMLQLGLQPYSHTCKLPDILNSIIEHLQDKRYFIIVDDLWDIRAWNTISCAFPQNNLCSRVLITTQIEDVARVSCGKHGFIHYMKPLSEQDSRKLFFERICDSEELCPAYFIELSSKILEKCGGLPLAIVTIASMIACQPINSKDQWAKYIQDSLGVGPIYEDMFHILDFSYKNLPHHLKACFLYLGTYPEDHKISRVELVRRWVAEGFISCPSRQDVWNVAESYFSELVNRSMIQPVYEYYDDIGIDVTHCRVHDMMLELILRKCRENNFITLIDAPGKVSEIQGNIVRRLTIQLENGYEDCITVMATNSKLSQVRSFNIFCGSVRIPKIAEFKCLRLLYLDIYCLDTTIYLSAINHLSQLRYLQITGGKSGEEVLVPAAQIRGRVLETLDLSRMKRCRGIIEIVDAPHLSHISVPWTEGLRLPDWIGKAKSLVTLCGFSLLSSSIESVTGLGELTALSELVLMDVPHNGTIMETVRSKALTFALITCLKKLSNLGKLVLRGGTALYGDAMLESSFLPPFRNIELLDLKMILLSGVPRWIGYLCRLRELTLVVNELNQEDFNVIGTRLTSLVILDMTAMLCPTDRIVIGGSTGFKSLKRFQFGLRGLSYLTFQVGAMPDLLALELTIFGDECNKDKVAPVWLQHLPSLKRIKVDAWFAGMNEDKKSLDLIRRMFQEVADAHPTRLAVDIMLF